MKTATPRSSGVALVVTLILLAIITFMTVTFLVLSRSQRGIVSNASEQAKAAKMAEMSLRFSLSQALAPVKAHGNPWAIDLMVSTNYHFPLGYQTVPALPRPGIDYNPVNVSYVYSNGLPLTGNDFLQHLENLYFSPRAPVYVKTGTSNDFRYYLDLNRNGRFDTNGWLPEYDDFLRPMTALDNQGNQYIPLKWFVGDPEWIGVLEKPEYHHSPTNLFVGRYAFIIIPASKTLDVNYAHNYAKGIYLGSSLAVNPTDGFMRNQGATTFEINLGAFLADLNSNYWPVQARSTVVNSYWWPTPTRPPYALPYAYYPVYDRASVVPNGGWAFTHAMGLVRYRYARSQANLPAVNNIFGTIGFNAFANDWVDEFAAGPVMTNTWWPVPVDGDNLPLSKNSGWPGSFAPYHFFTPQDFFDTNKTTTATTPFNLSTVLLSAGSGSNSYNRYTYYRMLAQLGTETGPGDPESDRINLNYVNVDTKGNVIPDMATNFLPWDPSQFFTNTVNRLLTKAGYNFSITNIQLFPTNSYSASVHRIMQVAANIYDATTNRTFGTSNAFPTVFRPIFGTASSNGLFYVHIVGYRELTPAEHLAFANITTPPTMYDLALTNTLKNLTSLDMVKGVPLVLGARKWFPNFNELELRTKLQATRKLEFVKTSATDLKPIATNEMLLLSVTNEFGLEAWNAYSNDYPRDLQMTVAAEMVATITNEYGAMVFTNSAGNVGAFSNYVAFSTGSAGPLQIPARAWKGFNPLSYKASFLTPFTPLNNHFMFLTNSSYSTINNQFISPVQTLFETGQGFVVPHWTLNLRTSLRFILFDPAAQRIVDYVNLANSSPPFDITSALFHGAVTNGGYDGSYGSMWVTNRSGNSSNVFSPTIGVLNQIQASLGMNSNNLVWNPATQTVPSGWDTKGAINFFRTNLLRLPAQAGAFSGPLYLTNRFYAPYNPTRDIYIYTSWQANDPLVHYTVDDLTPQVSTNACDWDTSAQQKTTVDNIGSVNSRYEPWPGDSLAANSGSATAWDMRVKDPLITRSSDWDFPTNKFPNPGWVGRIHRGTPWQTVYLKSAPVDLGTWRTWTGNGNTPFNMGQVSTSLAALTNYYADAIMSLPTNDWRLLDVFTTSLGDSASRGQLSINQTNLAAWSAVLGGVIVNPNMLSSYAIQPAGTYAITSPPPMITLHNAINDVRRTNAAFNGSFKRLGDILAVPELTLKSPFLTTTNVPDSMWERIPQQVLGLLKGGEQPRFVVYSYGQALKPADRSKVVSGPYAGLCTNYQITAETTTRAVVRIEGAPNNPRAVVESFTVLPPD